MNRLTNRSTMTAGSLLTSLPQITRGQVTPSEPRVEIPFGFTAAGKNFPPGTCLFDRDSGGRISLSTVTGKANAMPIATNSLARGSDAGDSLLAFEGLGGATVFLWNTLPDFLSTDAKPSILAKLMRERFDLSGTERTNLATEVAPSYCGSLTRMEHTGASQDKAVK